MLKPLFLLYRDCKCISVFLISPSQVMNQNAKVRNLISVLLGFRLYDLVLYFSVNVPQINESKRPKVWNLISVLSYLSVLSDFDCTTLLFISLSVFLKLMNQTPKSSNLDSCFIWVAIAGAFSQRSLCCILIVHQFSINRDRHLLSSISHEFEIAFNFLTTSPIWHSPFSRPWHCC